jgi:signal transduction histidine kinase
MIEPAMPGNDKQRVRILQEYAILDTLPEQDFDDITRLASSICGVPISIIGLIDTTRQWFKSHHGMDIAEIPRKLAFCAHAINNAHQVMVVPDTRKDERFADNPLVTEADVVFYTGVPLVNPEGYALGTLCIMDKVPRNITTEQKEALSILANQVVKQLELRRKNLQLELKQAEIEEINKELQLFAHVASHDLQEPLRMVTKFLGQIEKNYSEKLDENGKTYIHYARDGAQRMRTIISDLLEYSSAGHKTFDYEPIDMNELVQKTEQLLHAAIEDKSAVLRWQTLPSIIAARTPLQQVMLNLMSNAIKYHAPGNKPVITISSSEDADYWQFSIEDNGIGIDAKNFDKIFILFQRLVNKDDYPGTGIGLATTKKIVENHNGKIWLESTPSVGTKIYYTISKHLSQIN